MELNIESIVANQRPVGMASRQDLMKTSKNEKIEHICSLPIRRSQDTRRAVRSTSQFGI